MITLANYFASVFALVIELNTSTPKTHSAPAIYKAAPLYNCMKQALKNTARLHNHTLQHQQQHPN